MNRTYYVGEGPEAKDIIVAARLKVLEFHIAAEGLLKDMPEGTLTCAANGGTGIIVGFGIRQQMCPAALSELGLVPDVQRRTPEGDFTMTYKPNKRSKTGKELAQRMRNANKLHTTFSRQVIAALKVGRCVIDGRAMYSSVAGCKGDKLFVSIPGDPGDGNVHGWDRFPDVPAWFRAPQGDEAMFFLNGK